MHIIKTTAISIIYSWLTLTAAQAATQSLESISAAAEDLIRQQHPWQGMDVEIRARSLDPRTRLADCDLPLDAYLPHNSRVRANTTVAVRCQGAQYIFTVRVDSNLTGTCLYLVVGL